MDILPEKYSQFKDKKYWDHFFSSLRNTTNQYFQWYGSYQDYEHYLLSMIDKNSHIFHVGCGKSTFSQDLFCKNPNLNLKIVNCDYSENVIAQMKKRSQKMKIEMEYTVCDLLKQLQEPYINRFNVVLDKGTLDAMLPEDKPQNIKKIKQLYFYNMQKSLIKDQKHPAKFIIISLLQPFVLRTLVEHFGFQSSHSEIDIYECLIKDSKLQPFLVCITFNSQIKQKAIKYHSLDSKQIAKWLTIEQVLQNVQKKQQQISYGGRIKTLVSGRRTKFNIYNQDNRRNIRYILELVDSQEKQILKKNTCSIFIIPQGKENSYLFNDEEGVKALLGQISSSRLILVKLITGNEFKNLQQVKKELNSIIPDFIQDGSDYKKAPYLTDADQLGHKSYLYQNQQFIIDEVLVEEQPIRRIFLREVPTIPQCEFKLSYLSQNNNKQLKDIGSKILPAKKNLVIGIERQSLFDDNAKFIYSGLTGFYGDLSRGCRILVAGCQFALVKFLVDTVENIQISLVCGTHKLVKQIKKYVELNESDKLNIFPLSLSQFFKQNNEEKYNIIINCTNEQNNTLQPSLVQSSTKFQEQIVKHLQPPGIYVHQYRNYSAMPNLSEVFFPVYGSKSNSLDQNILFCLKYDKKYENDKIILHQNLINIKQKSKPKYEWEIENFIDLLMMQPNLKDQQKYKVQKTQKFLDIYLNVDEEEEKGDKKTNKKKKKKR